MKATLFLLALFASAYTLSLAEVDLTMLIQTGNPANEAVQAVYDLLRDLKQANLDAQHAADQKNTTDEDVAKQIISALTNVMNINRDAWQEAKNHREWVDSEIISSQKYIEWATGRIAEIERRGIDLQEMRCFSNGLFVRSIKQHQDGLKVIRTLKQDLSGYLSGTNSAFPEIKVENVADKLKMYSNLFNQKALEQFTQLAAEQASGGAELYNAGNQDNTPGKQHGDNLTQQIYNVLLSLEQQLDESLKILEENEVDAAYHLADWLSDSESEKATLSQEIEKKTEYVEKLTQAHLAALAQQAKANSILTESQAAVNQAVADLQERRDFWQEEFNRRNEENAIIDEVVHIFKDQVKDMVGGSSFGR